MQRLGERMGLLTSLAVGGATLRVGPVYCRRRSWTSRDHETSATTVTSWETQFRVAYLQSMPLASVKSAIVYTLASVKLALVYSRLPRMRVPPRTILHSHNGTVR